MKNALILHGTGNNSQGNWFPWLRSELEKKGWKVWAPDLPESKNPSVKRYNDFIFSNPDWKFNNESIIVGHSSGAVAILGLLQHLPEENKIDSCFLVGSFKNSLGIRELDGLFEEPFDFEKIKEHARKFIFIHSDNDPYCPLEDVKFLAEKVGGELIVKSGQGHFNLEISQEYKKFPALLKLIEK